mmetsp:Transcript_12990/g.47473  ORF Transcript_12990/g.47473 Transcript_12990/m.47473 type:complete len:392 (-) Transcript_12990:267-1442(-)
MPGLHWNETGWTVDCICGVNYDDGEEMIECETCNVWLHTTCMGSLAKKTPFSCPSCTSGHTRRGGCTQGVKVPSISSYAQRHGVILENANGLYQETLTDYSHVDPLEGARPCFGRSLWRAVGLTPKVLGKRREDALAALAAKSNSETTKSPSRKKSRKSSGTEGGVDSGKTPVGKSMLGNEEIEQKVTSAPEPKPELSCEGKEESKTEQQTSAHATESADVTVVDTHTEKPGVSSFQCPTEPLGNRETSSSPPPKHQWSDGAQSVSPRPEKEDRLADGSAHDKGVAHLQKNSKQINRDQNVNASDSGNSDDSLAGRGDDAVVEGDHDMQNNSGDGPSMKETATHSDQENDIGNGESKSRPDAADKAREGQTRPGEPSRILGRTLDEVASLA